MVSECERLFREALDALILDTTLALPPGLREAFVEHRQRRDGAGHTLCVANPERERLLDELATWFLAPHGGTP